MSSSVKSSTGSVTANGQTICNLTNCNATLALYVGGTFSATVGVVARPAGSGDPFVPIIPLGGTTGALTVAGLYVFPYIPGDYDYAVLSTAFTSGTALCQLSAGPSN